jgi:hypothetical protein
MMFETPAGMICFLSLYGRNEQRRRGDRRHWPLIEKHLTLYDATLQQHFLSELPLEEPSEPDFMDHLQRIFKSARGGHLVLRVPVRGADRRITGPDRVFVFTISSGRATRVPDREVVVMLGRATVASAEFYGGTPKWRSKDFVSKERQEAVSA